MISQSFQFQFLKSSQFRVWRENLCKRGITLTFFLPLEREIVRQTSYWPQRAHRYGFYLSIIEFAHEVNFNAIHADSLARTILRRKDLCQGNRNGMPPVWSFSSFSPISLLLASFRTLHLSDRSRSTSAERIHSHFCFLFFNKIF